MTSRMEPGAAAQPPLDSEVVDKAEGPVSAAILSCGVGALALGVLTTLAEASVDVKDFLNLYDPVGPLAGKTIGAVAIWLVSWAVLHFMYRDKPFESRKALTAALVLIALGVLGTFPTFFQSFAPDEPPAPPAKVLLWR